MTDSEKIIILHPIKNELACFISDDIVLFIFCKKSGIYMPHTANLSYENNPSLLAGAPQLKNDLLVWREDIEIRGGGGRLVAALALGEPTIFSDLVFADSKLPQYALLAYSENKITLAQFTTIILKWSAEKDYPERWNIQFYQLNDNPDVKNQFELFLNLQTIFQYKDKLTKSQIDEIYKDILLNSSVPKSEKIFMTFEVKEQDLALLFKRALAIKFNLFFPIKTEIGYRFIVPSFTILQTTLNHLAITKIQLVPTIGESTAEDVLAMHKIEQHPFGLSFPGYEHEVADYIPSGPFGYSLHDFYHGVILSHNPSLPLIHYIAELIKNKNNSHEKLSNHTYDNLIDADFRNFLYCNLSPNFKAEITEISILVNILFVIYCPNPILDNMDAILKLIIDDILANTDTWIKLGFDSKKFFLSTNIYSPITEIMKKNHNDEINAKLNQFISTYLIKFRSLLDEQVILQNSSKSFWFNNFCELYYKLCHVNTEEDFNELLNQFSEYKPYIPYLCDLSHGDQLSPFKNVVKKRLHHALKKLFELGAKPGDQNNKVTTPLHIAFQQNDMISIMLLCDAGFDPYIVDENNCSSIYYAMINGYKDAVNYFLSRFSIAKQSIIALQEKKLIHSDIQPIIDTYVKFMIQLYEVASIKRLNHIPDLTEIEKTFESIGSYPFTISGCYMYPTMHNHYRDNEHSPGDIRPISFPDSNPIFNLLSTKCWEYLLSVSSKRVSLNEPDQYGRTFFTELCSSNITNSAVFELLIKNGAKVDVVRPGGHTPLNSAINNNNFELAKCLLKNGAIITDKVAFAFIDLLKRDKILRDGGSIDSQIALINLLFAYGLGQLINSKVIWQENYWLKNQREHDLYFTSFWSMLCKSPIKGGLYDDIDLGIYSAPVSIRKICLENGADPDVLHYDGQPELFYAVMLGDINYFKLLIKRGANVNLTDSAGNTALHIVVREKKLDFIEFLLNKGALQVKNNNGETPLKLANNTQAIVDLLQPRYLSKVGLFTFKLPLLNIIKNNIELKGKCILVN